MRTWWRRRYGHTPSEWVERSELFFCRFLGDECVQRLCGLHPIRLFDGDHRHAVGPAHFRRLKAENALWAVGGITLASIITLLLEIVFPAFRRSNDLIDGIAERLDCVGELPTRYAMGETADAAIQTTLERILQKTRRSNTITPSNAGR